MKRSVTLPAGATLLLLLLCGYGFYRAFKLLPQYSIYLVASAVAVFVCFVASHILAQRYWFGRPLREQDIHLNSTVRVESVVREVRKTSHEGGTILYCVYLVGDKEHTLLSLPSTTALAPGKEYLYRKSEDGTPGWVELVPPGA